MTSVHCVIFVVVCATFFTTTTGTITQEISDATTQFSLNLLKTVLHDKSGNVILSPLSVYTLLAILQQGANTTSREELNNVLHALPNDTKEGYHNITTEYQNSRSIILEFVNRAFVKSGHTVLPEFKQSLVSDFLSDIDSVDFSDSNAASQHINSWVAQSTHDRITELFAPDDIPPNAFMVLANAIYFNANWKTRFYTTENRTFSPNPNEDKQVPSMYQEKYYHAGVDAELGAKWVHMSLGNDDEFTVLLVLPTERHGLANLVNNLTTSNLANIFSHTGLMEVKLTLPKFTLNTDTKLIPVLKELGINEVFDDRADLSGITIQPLKVSDVIQKAEIAIDEEGVTATAATAILTMTKSGMVIMGLEELIFTVDEPFLVFIIDRDNSVPLFAGRVSDPSGQ